MKKLILSVVCCSVLCSTSVPYAFAAQEPVPYVAEQFTQQLPNGIIVERTIVEYTHDTRSNEKTKTVDVTDTYSYKSEKIGAITIRGTFAYNGKTSYVIEKEIVSVKEYSGWTFKEKSFTSSDNSIRLTGKFEKGSDLAVIVDSKLSCDKNGNIR